MLVNALVEGIVDEAAARRIITAAGHEFGTCYGKHGSGYIKEKADGFNNAARVVPLLGLVDHVDTGLLCPPDVVSHWLPHRRPLMLLRVVVRELESWLLADRENLAHFLKVPPGRIPRAPEDVEDPKRTLVNLARRSRSSTIRDALVPRRGSTSQEGVLYTSEMVRFIREGWNLDTARERAGSMDRCLRRLEQLPPAR
jgi:hypothetical protein